MSKSGKAFGLGIVAGVVLTIVSLVMLVMFVQARARQQLAARAGATGASTALQRMLAPPLFPPDGPVASNWRFRSLDGRPFSLAQTRGKVVFLNFWATWCTPCVAEMPNMQRLQNMMRGQDILFLFVSQEQPEKVRQFVAKQRLTLPVYTTTDRLPRDLATRSIPTTFILSRDGKLAFRHSGSARWDDPTAVAFLMRLLDAKTAGR